jgi:hypothetical protein
MQNFNISPVDQILDATSLKFDAEEYGEGDALVIPTNGFSSYGRPLFRVTECEIFMLREDGSVWDEYDMPEDGDVVSEIVKIMSSIGL